MPPSDPAPDPLPAFPYHPDPLTTGSVVATPGTCACCGKTRTHLYAGPVHAVVDPDGPLCPWCIADGSAVARYEAHFSGGVAGHGDVPQQVLLSIAERTPGFTGWQDSSWLVHCGDGAAFLGRAGAAELAAHPDAVDHLRREVESWGWTGHGPGTSRVPGPCAAEAGWLASAAVVGGHVRAGQGQLWETVRP